MTASRATEVRSLMAATLAHALREVSDTQSVVLITRQGVVDAPPRRPARPNRRA